MAHVRRSEVAGRRDAGLSQYARIAHSDYGPEFEPLFRRMLVARYGVPEDEAQRCGICAANLWAPIDRPAYKDPLCLLDASSLRLEADTVRYVTLGDIGFNSKQPSDSRVPVSSQDAPSLGVAFAPRHRWVYLPDMLPTEAVVFKQYDFRPCAAAKCTFHHAVTDGFHDAWKECPGRRSIECRVFLTFDGTSSSGSEATAAASKL